MMPKEADAGALERMLREVLARQEAQEKLLITMESRLEMILGLARKNAETTSRLKLMADNARQASRAHSDALKSLAARLESPPKSG